MTTTFIFYNNNQIKLEATLHRATTFKPKGIILYFHGGGLIYGNRNDLPTVYMDLLTTAGYSVLTLDYPFVPEIKIDKIIACLEDGILRLNNMEELKDENFDRMIYFGRSAGAYLAIQLTNSSQLTPPKRLISFYGYYSLENELLSQPSAYYRNFQSVPFMTVYELVSKTPLTSAPIETRFPIYLYYRQTGNWVKELLGRKNNASDFSLNEKDLENLPPTFIAASSADQDVPFSISQKMSQFIPSNHTFFIEDLPHDFDSNLQIESGLDAYKDLIKWLEIETNKKL